MSVRIKLTLKTMLVLIIMLTYDIIIKHLMPEINNFSLQPNIVMKSCDFPVFNSLFDDTFYRFGVDTNNSLINSIKYCFNINTDNINLSSNITDIIKQLDINIIVFDFKNSKITIEHNNDYINPWKPTIFLANYSNNYYTFWEPIVCKDTKVFSFSSPKAHILKNNIYNQIINNNSNINSNININDNFQEILSLEGFNVKDNISSEVLSNDSEESNNDTFITKEAINDKSYSFAKLNKMKKEELVLLCKNMNKVITKKSFTKKDLIDLIIN